MALWKGPAAPWGDLRLPTPMTSVVTLQLSEMVLCDRAVELLLQVVQVVAGVPCGWNQRDLSQCVPGNGGS